MNSLALFVLITKSFSKTLFSLKISTEKQFTVYEHITIIYTQTLQLLCHMNKL